MISDKELWAVALHVEREHGDEAPAFIGERVKALALKGDMAGVETWKAVAARLDRIKPVSQSVLF